MAPRDWITQSFTWNQSAYRFPVVKDPDKLDAMDQTVLHGYWLNMHIKWQNFVDNLENVSERLGLHRPYYKVRSNPIISSGCTFCEGTGRGISFMMTQNTDKCPVCEGTGVIERNSSTKYDLKDAFKALEKYEQ